MTQSMDARNWTTLLVLSIVWGASFLASEIALEEMSALVLVTWRIVIAAIILIPLVQLKGGFSKSTDFWRKVAVIGFFNSALPFSLIGYSQTYLTGGHAAVLNATVPLWTVFVAWLLVGERVTSQRLGGVLLGIFGVALMTGIGALQGLGDSVVPQLAVLLATLSYAIAAVLTRKWLADYSGTNVAGCSVLFGALYMLIISGVNGVELINAEWHMRTYIWVLFLGAISTAAAYVLFFTLLREAGASNATLVVLIVPVTASLMVYLVLGQVLTMEQFIGMAIILFSLLIIDNRISIGQSKAPSNS